MSSSFYVSRSLTDMPIIKKSPIHSTINTSIRNPQALQAAMNANEVSRRNAAMGKTIVLNPNQPNFPIVSFKVHQLVEYINKKIPEYLPKTTDSCWLKGSWTNDREEFPNDVDIGISLADPNFEVQFNTILAEFLLAHANKTEKDLMASKVYSKGLPVSVYFKPLLINNPGSTSLAFLTYKSIDLDLTIFRDPARWSVGPMDGKWLHCKENFKRHSMGKEFAKTFDQFGKGQYCIDHHLNPIEDPATLHNVTFRVLLETTRRACLIDSDTQFVISNEIFKGKPIAAFAKQWISHQQDHYKNDTSKVIEYLNLLYIYQNSSFGCSYIAQAWQQTSLSQNIKGMDELNALIIKNPKVTPHLLKFIQLLLITKGNQAYEFEFNDKGTPNRPFVSVKAGNQTNYLLLPQIQGSPFQLAQSVMDSLPKFMALIKQFEEPIGYENLSFLKGIFSHLGIDSKNSENLDNSLHDFQTYFRSSKIELMQRKFRSYLNAESVLKKIETFKANMKSFSLDFGTTIRPKIPAESKRETSLLPQKIQLDPKESAERELLKNFEEAIRKHNLSPLNETAKLFTSLMDIDYSKPELAAKHVEEMLDHLRIRSNEIFADEQIQKTLAVSCYKDMLGQILPIIFAKILKNPTDDVFEKSYNLYVMASEQNCFSHVQEDKVVTSLFNSWKLISPKIYTELYAKGCHLICNAFKKQLLNDKEIIHIAFEKLVASRQTAHLRMAYTKLNEVLTHLKQPEIVTILKPLVANTLLNNSPELPRPMYKALVNLYKRDLVTFEKLMDSPGIHRGPAISLGIQAFVSTLKYNGDETLIFETLLCLLSARPHHSVIKSSLNAFNALIHRQAIVKVEKGLHISLKTKERMGLIAREFLKLGITPKGPMQVEWLESIVEPLIKVPTMQDKSLDGSLYNPHQELGYELLSLLIFSSKDPVWQERLQTLMPKVAVVKKIKDIVENGSEKVERAVHELTEIISKGRTKTQKIRTIGHRIFTTLQQVQQEELEKLSKSLYEQLVNNIQQAQFLLSNTKDLPTVNLAHQIFMTARAKNLVNSEIVDQNQNTLWIIQGHLNNATSKQDIKWTSKLMPLINTFMANLGDGSKIQEYRIDTIIEALGRLSKETIEEKTVITNHLITLCKCKIQNLKTRGLLIETICSVIKEFAKQADVEYYGLALKLFNSLIRDIPLEEHRQQFKETLEAIARCLPVSWKGPNHFNQLKEIVNFLKSSGILLRVEEKIQFAIIAALHRTQSTERQYIWELIEGISEKRSSSYNTLLRYFEFALDYKDIRLSLATMFNKHYSDGKKYWSDSNKLMADGLLISIYSATGNMIYLKSAIKTFCSMTVDRRELAKKIMINLYAVPIEHFDDEILNFLKDHFPLVLNYSAAYSTSRNEKFNDATFEFVTRLLESENAKHLNLGLKLTNFLLQQAEYLGRIIVHEKIGHILNMNLNHLLKSFEFTKLNEIIDAMQPVVSKEILIDLYKTLEIGAKKISNQYMVRIPKTPIEKITTITAEVMENFIPFVANYFPEFGRKFFGLFIKQACIVAPNFAIAMPFFYPQMESLGLYNNTSVGPFVTCKANEKEQFEINNERLIFETENVVTLMINIPTHPIALDSLQHILLMLQRLCSIHSPSGVEQLIKLNILYTQYQMNIASISINDKRFLNYTQEVLAFCKKIVSEVKKFQDNPNEKAEDKAVCLKSASAVLHYFRMTAMTLAILPKVYKNVYASAEELGWKKEAAFEFVKKLVTADFHSGIGTSQNSKFTEFLKLTSIFEKFRGVCGEDSQAVLMKFSPKETNATTFVGFSLMKGPKDFENVRSNEALELVSQLTTTLAENFFQLQNEVALMHNNPLYYAESEAEKIGLMHLIEFFLEPGLKGAAKAKFVEACLKMRKDHKVKALNINRQTFLKGIDLLFDQKKSEKDALERKVKAKKKKR